MSAPVKPWETDFAGTVGSDKRIRLESSATLPTMMGSVRPARLQQVPSVPPRPWMSRTQPRLNSYGYGTTNPYNMFGGYGNYGSYGGYGGYGGYGSYGGYGGYRSFGANRFGGQGPEDPENRFIQIAEEATRPAFDSIQSVVDAFGSVSFMLESTYQAVVHTFRAVLGIAEHLGQLRSIFAALNVFRLVRWAYRKLCQILGVKTSASQDSIWHDAASTVDSIPVAESSAPKWPIFVYFSIVVSGPLLMWRLLKSLSVENNVTTVWDPKMEPPSQFAVVMYPFTGQTDKELSIGAGKMVGLAPSQYQTNLSSGWALVTADRRIAGLVPVNYMQQVQYAPNSKQAGHTAMSAAVATTNKETVQQQTMNTFPVATDIGTPHVPVFKPAGSVSNSSHPAVFPGPSTTVPVAAKSHPTGVSPSDSLPVLAELEETPFTSAVGQEVESSQTFCGQQTETSTDKAS